MTLREQRIALLAVVALVATLAVYCFARVSIARDGKEWIDTVNAQAKSGLESRGDAESLKQSVSAPASNTISELVGK